MPGKEKDKKKSLHSSIFFVMIWINLFSIITLTAFNYYVFQFKSGKAYLQSFISYNEQITNLAFKNIDRQIMQSVLKLPQLYFSPIKENAAILLPQSEPIAGSSQHIMELSTEMKKIQKNYPHVAGIDIYYEATGTVVTGFNKIHFPFDEALRDTYLPWYKTYQEMEPLSGGVWIQGKTYLMDEPGLLYISRVSRPEWHGSDIVLSICISLDSFSEFIDQSEGALAITTQNNRLLYSSTAAAQDFISAGGKAEEDGPLEKENLMIFHETSPTSGLNYYYGIDSSRFYEDYEITNRMMLFNFLLSILFNIVMLLLITYYNHTAYRRRVQTLSKEAGISMEDSDKSFDGTLHVLAKELHTLHETVSSSKGMLFQSAVRSLILNQKAGIRDEKIAPYLTRQTCCVVLMSIPGMDMDHMPVEDLQADYPPGANRSDVLFTIVERQELAAVLIFEEDDWESVRESFIRDMDERWTNNRLVTGRVLPIQKEGIKNSYRSALEAARYQYIFTEERHLSYEQVHHAERKESGSHLKLFDAIRRDINNESLSNLETRVKMLVTSFKNGNYTIDYCQSTLRDFVTLLYQIMQQNQLDMWVVFGYDIRDYYKRISNIDVFETWCINLCEVILKNIDQKKQSVDTDLQSRILALVDEHLENDISLDFLADELHIRPDAASRMFRQIIGTGYTEYIKNKKLSRAKELMEAGLSVKDTAERLGYSSAQYFIKVFKEDCGMTPHQYKKHQAEKRD